jgi:hypothetical protein
METINEWEKYHFVCCCIKKGTEKKGTEQKQNGILLAHEQKNSLLSFHLYFYKIPFYRNILIFPAEVAQDNIENITQNRYRISTTLYVLLVYTCFFIIVNWDYNGMSFGG